MKISMAWPNQNPNHQADKEKAEMFEEDTFPTQDENSNNRLKLVVQDSPKQKQIRKIAIVLKYWCYEFSYYLQDR